MEIIETKLNWAGALAKRKTVDMIVLHHADSKHCSIYNVHHWHLSNGWSGCGYHFFINKQGRIFRGRPEDTIGSHAKGFNSTSFGVCFEGDFTAELPTNEQITAGLELIAHLKQKYGINKIKGHGDLMATSCPGHLFPMEKFIDGSENLILSFQRSANADGFKFDKFGLDGKYGAETQAIMQKCVIKKRLVYKYKNATKLAQRLLGITIDGKAGKQTAAAIKKFQEENGLTADSAIGVQTWKKLLNIND